MTSLLITNALVVNEGTLRELDVYIDDGRIAKLGADLSSQPADRVIDATGKHLLPGMIDDQVHFREPGLTHKGEIATESAAAVAGGITSYFEMPNANPLTINREALEDKYQRAAQKSLANFAFYLGASNDNLENIKSLDPKAACGIKVFMGASTGNMLVDKPEILEGIFQYAPTIVVTHCEDTPMIKANEDQYREQYGEDIPMSCHPLIRSQEACYKSSSFAVELAKRFDTRLHVLHLTTEKEMALFRAGPLAEKRITAEACVHHLFFSEEDYEAKGSLIKCNPAVKKASDRQAILDAINSDLIDVVATDHAPHTWDEKQGTYFKAPAGLPLVQHAVVSMLEHYHRGQFSLETIVQKTSHNVAQLFQIENRGYIREGYWADLTLVDLNAPTVVDDQKLYSKCGWSPFGGYIFKSSIVATLVNGEVAFEAGKVNQSVRGARIAFER
ncbi:dihydroorotase [Ketobacter sp. MCCC 1A13808]|uniref:dihydroorotase n=1 Tax=Ketobacter sp. MCCC 1A13808 TaxID=2602738 RepID=UPI0012EC6050|nr:dihydroorotase [Ketobacter sp. MCCC 1A13808]MVF14640.1 dihydroorotase [Ketobacter sp. MCCC 1A13808]